MIFIYFARKSRFLSLCRQALYHAAVTRLHPSTAHAELSVRWSDRRPMALQSGPVRSIPCSSPVAVRRMWSLRVPPSRTPYAFLISRHIGPSRQFLVRTPDTGGVPQDALYIPSHHRSRAFVASQTPRLGGRARLRRGLCLMSPSPSCS